MKKILFIFLAWCSMEAAVPQTVTNRLTKAFQKFENEDQLRHAVSSLYVLEGATGAVIFDKNSSIGLAPASTQKLITSVTAYELLGKDFRYQTRLAYDGTIEGDRLKGNLYVIGSGDPTLGSWRWRETRDTVVMRKWAAALRSVNIKGIEGKFIGDDSHFESQSIPNGWIWQDIGNYYGAGCYGLNWKENQYDIRLASGNKIGDSVRILQIDLLHNHPMEMPPVRNELRSAAKGTGDNAYVYFPLNSTKPTIYLRGTIPVGERNFSISASMPYPPYVLLLDAFEACLENDPEIFFTQVTSDVAAERLKATDRAKVISTHYSPPLDSMVYWLNRKSINLYAEALLKTIAFQKYRLGATDKGIESVKDFWKNKGISEMELAMADGSGLSPLNRVTTKAQVAILNYARKQSWFNGFYQSLPQFNGMKIKSGTINGVKAFAGYHRSQEGREYVFSFIVNNYTGSASALVQKMYEVLDELK